MGLSKEKRVERYKKGLCVDCTNARFNDLAVCEKCKERKSQYHKKRFKSDRSYRERLKTKSIQWQKIIQNEQRQLRAKVKNPHILFVSWKRLPDMVVNVVVVVKQTTNF